MLEGRKLMGDLGGWSSEMDAGDIAHHGVMNRRITCYLKRKYRGRRVFSPNEHKHLKPA